MAFPLMPVHPVTKATLRAGRGMIKMTEKGQKDWRWQVF